ncbi:hypothetical protein BLNAU_2865 [Blattamonas nauphoetae]|uniref:Uncharacterized protein n=1 Tax=Blattamonas nauphoetae TaxID=2049346 RepID=A0ABQ9YER6_9EUKA|nr:hypothetical protein BLNAU_2865 [Blattamonas nauphoetae]
MSFVVLCRIFQLCQAISSTTGIVGRKDKIMAIVQFSPIGTNTPMYTSAFQITVDELSSGRVYGIFNTTSASDRICDTTPDGTACNYNFTACIRTSSGDICTASQRWMTGSGSSLRYIPYFTVLITTVKGNITGLAFEKSTSGCSKSHLDSICTAPFSTSKDSWQYQQVPTFHFAWVGTDKSGTTMKSEGQVLSTYRLYSTSDFGLAVADEAKDIWDRFKKNATSTS